MKHSIRAFLLTWRRAVAGANAHDEHPEAGGGSAVAEKDLTLVKRMRLLARPGNISEPDGDDQKRCAEPGQPAPATPEAIFH